MLAFFFMFYFAVFRFMFSFCFFTRLNYVMTRMSYVGTWWYGNRNDVFCEFDRLVHQRIFMLRINYFGFARFSMQSIVIKLLAFIVTMFIMLVFAVTGFNSIFRQKLFMNENYRIVRILIDIIIWPVDPIDIFDFRI